MLIFLEFENLWSTLCTGIIPRIKLIHQILQQQFGAE